MLEIPLIATVGRTHSERWRNDFSFGLDGWSANWIDGPEATPTDSLLLLRTDRWYLRR
jgi:hypothetical protein